MHSRSINLSIVNLKRKVVPELQGP